MRPLVEDFVELRDPEVVRAFMREICASDLSFERLYRPEELRQADPELMKMEQELLNDYNEWKRAVAKLMDRGMQLSPADLASIAGRVGTLISNRPGMPQDFAFVLPGTPGGIAPSFALPYTVWFFHQICSGGQELPSSEAEQANDEGDALHRVNPEEALRYFRRATTLSPSYALAWVNAGIAWKNLGEIEPSLTAYAHVIQRIDSRYRKAWYNAAVAFLAVGDVKYALSCCEKSLELSPGYAAALRLLPRLRGSTAHGSTAVGEDLRRFWDAAVERARLGE